MGNFESAADALAYLRFGNIPLLMHSCIQDEGPIKDAEYYFENGSTKYQKKIKKLIELIDSALKINDKNKISNQSENIFKDVVNLYNELFNDIDDGPHSSINDFGFRSKLSGSKYIFKQFDYLLNDFEDWEEYFKREKYKENFESVLKIKELWETNSFDDSNPTHKKYLEEFKNTCQDVIAYSIS